MSRIIGDIPGTAFLRPRFVSTPVTSPIPPSRRARCMAQVTWCSVMESAFHPDAANRFNELGHKLSESVRAIRKT